MTNLFTIDSTTFDNGLVDTRYSSNGRSYWAEVSVDYGPRRICFDFGSISLEGEIEANPLGFDSLPGFVGPTYGQQFLEELLEAAKSYGEFNGLPVYQLGKDDAISVFRLPKIETIDGGIILDWTLVPEVESVVPTKVTSLTGDVRIDAFGGDVIASNCVHSKNFYDSQSDLSSAGVRTIVLPHEIGYMAGFLSIKWWQPLSHDAIDFRELPHWSGWVPKGEFQWLDLPFQKIITSKGDHLSQRTDFDCYLVGIHPTVPAKSIWALEEMYDCSLLPLVCPDWAVLPYGTPSDGRLLGMNWYAMGELDDRTMKKLEEAFARGMWKTYGEEGEWSNRRLDFLRRGIPVLPERVREFLTPTSKPEFKQNYGDVSIDVDMCQAMSGLGTRVIHIGRSRQHYEDYIPFSEVCKSLETGTQAGQSYDIMEWPSRHPTVKKFEDLMGFENFPAVWKMVGKMYGLGDTETIVDICEKALLAFTPVK